MAAAADQRGFLLPGGLLLVMMLALAWPLGNWARDRALQHLDVQAQQELELYVSHLNGQLERFAYLPALLSGDRRLAELLARPDDSLRVGEVNRFLSYVNRITGALDVYLMDAEGLTLAASNWQQPNTFVGNNFAFRPYFQQAMQGGPGRYFALGTTSQRRGYYFSYPVLRDGAPLGVVVVKLPVDTLESEWQDRRSVVAITDPDGVIFVASRPSWRYRTTKPLTRADRERIEASRRYPNTGLQLLRQQAAGLEPSGAQLVRVGGAASGEEYLRQSLAMPEAGWQVHLYADMAPVNAAMWQTRLIVLGVAGVVMMGFVAWAQRQHRQQERARHEEEKRHAMEQALAQLEDRVARRTNDLTEANRQLQEEVDRHRHTQDELIQSAKLAALGQMSAGISHELNQPLAAIRAYADSARSLLAHDRFDEAADNMRQIAELTERMAHISAQLKVFARKSEGQLTRVSLRASIDGALKILRPRIRDAGAEIRVELQDEDLAVQADMVQLEQILVNLIGNALDAVSGEGAAVVEIAAEARDGRVLLRVRDHGPGIPAQNLARVFDPFFTTSDSGLGLGLSISHRIAERLDGELTAGNHPEGGAEFRLDLAAASG